MLMQEVHVFLNSFFECNVFIAVKIYSKKFRMRIFVLQRDGKVEPCSYDALPKASDPAELARIFGLKILSFQEIDDENMAEMLVRIEWSILLRGSSLQIPHGYFEYRISLRTVLYWRTL